MLSASGEAHVVEIRSLGEPVNSCGCADHRANGLGTCKHVEGVLQRLRTRCAFVLTGTPRENRIDEVYSIAQFPDPALFGSLFRFNREFYVLDDHGRPAGYRNLEEMHRRLQPVMLRRRNAEVEPSCRVAA